MLSPSIASARLSKEQPKCPDRHARQSTASLGHILTRLLQRGTSVVAKGEMPGEGAQKHIPPLVAGVTRLFGQELESLAGDSQRYSTPDRPADMSFLSGKFAGKRRAITYRQSYMAKGIYSPINSVFGRQCERRLACWHAARRHG